MQDTTFPSGAISKQPILAKALLDTVKLLVELLVDVVVVPFTFKILWKQVSVWVGPNTFRPDQILIDKQSLNLRVPTFTHTLVDHGGAKLH